MLIDTIIHVIQPWGTTAALRYLHPVYICHKRGLVFDVFSSGCNHPSALCAAWLSYIYFLLHRVFNEVLSSCRRCHHRPAVTENLALL